MIDAGSRHESGWFVSHSSVKVGLAGDPGMAKSFPDIRAVGRLSEKVADDTRQRASPALTIAVREHDPPSACPRQDPQSQHIAESPAGHVGKKGPPSTVRRHFLGSGVHRISRMVSPGDPLGDPRRHDSQPMPTGLWEADDTRRTRNSPVARSPR